MTINLTDKITNRENLYWAWEKAKFFYKPGDVWFDEIELAGFEANLELEINSIITDIREGKYKLNEIRPIGFPKAGEDNDGNLKTRQTFWVSVRDQVAWIAVINIIGPYLDEMMPFWSYGNRLYISVFYDEDEVGKKVIRFGHYRNTSKHLLRKWNQSWPMFRKHIALTIKKMCHQPIDETEEQLQEINNQVIPKQLHCAYLDDGFWDHLKSNDIYWASIDFEKFYPSAKIETVRNNIFKYLSKIETLPDDFKLLINALTTFKIDSSGWEPEELKNSIQIEGVLFQNIPTGLFAAHFLANILLLEIDIKAHERLLKNKNIAQFRFVDDHVILCDNFEDLKEWIEWYKKELDEHSTGAGINYKKTEPEKLREYLVASGNGELNSKQEADAKSSCKLDPEYPSPLMTQTLNKISKINETEFDLLDSDDKNRFIADIEHLLLAEFNEQEIRKDTRLSFAATILTRLVPKIIIDDNAIIDTETKLINLFYNLNKTEKAGSISEEQRKKTSDLITNLQNELRKLKENMAIRYDLLYKKTFKILLKVIYENFDKVRLWNRALEFCFNTGYNGTTLIIELIDKLKSENKASRHTIIFIESLVLQVLSNLGLRAVKNIISNNISENQRTTSELFLHSISEPDLLVRMKITDGKFYHTKSILLFEKTLEVIRFTLTDKPKISFIDVVTESKQIALGKTENYSVMQSPWIWWFNSKLKLDYYTPTKVWLETINNLGFEYSIDISLASLYPKATRSSLFKKIENHMSNEGWVFDFIKGSAVEELRILTESKLIEMVLIKMESNTESITLYDWNTWLENLELKLHKKFYDNNQGYYDTRLSEWTVLEIIRQITKELILALEEPFLDQPEAPYLRYVHPNNYLIPSEWTEDKGMPFSWHEWEVITSVNTIKFNHESKFINDERFSPQISNAYGDEDIIESVLLGLGALLTCLLSRDFNLPANWNSIGHQKAWLNLIYTKLNSVHVSSLTKQLLDSIFSKRNKETMLLNLFFGKKEYEFAEDVLIDPPRIDTLQDLYSLIVASQNILKSYRLNIQDNLPRQLIPVSFKQLTKQYQPYNNEGDDE